jgi:S1-C subfamily serine protease
VGDVVIAIGNPFGVGQTVTHGIISALARTQVGITDYQFFIQTDAAINPGNSGGALVDMTGKLVGVNTAIFSRPAARRHRLRHSSEHGACCGRFREGRRQCGEASVAWRAPAGGNAGDRRNARLKRPTGALVANVTSGSPSAKAGLKLSDLILSIDGQVIDDPNAFDYRFATRPLGGTAQVDVLRGGKPVKLSIALETAPDTGRDEIAIKARSPFQGAKVANISPALADELKLDSSIEGIVVTDLPENAIAANVGFKKGDVIVLVNGQKIGHTRDLDKLAAEGSRLWRITVIRGGQQLNVVLGG